MGIAYEQPCPRAIIALQNEPENGLETRIEFFFFGQILKSDLGVLLVYIVNCGRVIYCIWYAVWGYQELSLESFTRKFNFRDSFLLDISTKTDKVCTAYSTI